MMRLLHSTYGEWGQTKNNTKECHRLVDEVNVRIVQKLDDVVHLWTTTERFAGLNFDLRQEETFLSPNTFIKTNLLKSGVNWEIFHTLHSDSVTKQHFQNVNMISHLICSFEERRIYYSSRKSDLTSALQNPHFIPIETVSFWEAIGCQSSGLAAYFGLLGRN